MSEKKETVNSQEIVRVGIIGAGRTGMPLIKGFLQFSYIKILCVCDMNPESEGMKIAQEKNIFTTTNIEDVVNLGEELDLVINVTGDPTLRKRLINYYLRVANAHTLIVPEIIARLMVSLAERSTELMKSLHSRVEGL